MITKERIEELIEQGATIYSNDYGEIQLIKENDLSLYENGQNNYILYALEPNKKYHNEIFDEDLFETKEDAEEYAEFGNITRTEKLPYVSWERFKNTEGNYSFKVYPYDYYCYTDGRYVRIKQYYGSLDRIVFTKPLTRENYNEARRICVKLFKGEGV